MNGAGARTACGAKACPRRSRCSVRWRRQRRPVRAWRRRALPEPIRDVVMILGYTSWAGAARRGRVHARGSADARVDRLRPGRSSPGLQPLPLAAREAGALGAGRRCGAVSCLREIAGCTSPPGFAEPIRPALAAVERSCAAYERSVRAAAERFGLIRPAVISTHPLIAGFGRFEWSGPGHLLRKRRPLRPPPLARWRPAIEASFARMRDRGPQGRGPDSEVPAERSPRAALPR